MTYTIVWRLSAVLQLNAVAATDPVRVRDAANRIDWALRRSPRDMGEARDPGYRLWCEDVLGVYYRIDEIAMTVEGLFCGPARRH